MGGGRGLNRADRLAEFRLWFGAYPRQEGEAPAEAAWLAAEDLPPLPELMARLATQVAARPEARFWPAPERYLRERRWRAVPPAQGDAAAREERASPRERRIAETGEVGRRRRRLREISQAAGFDPGVPDDAREG